MMTEEIKKAVLTFPKALKMETYCYASIGDMTPAGIEITDTLTPDEVIQEIDLTKNQIITMEDNWVIFTNPETMYIEQIIALVKDDDDPEEVESEALEYLEQVLDAQEK